MQWPCFMSHLRKKKDWNIVADVRSMLEIWKEHFHTMVVPEITYEKISYTEPE